MQTCDKAPAAPAVLQKAGVKFALYSDGVDTPREFQRAVKKAIDAGLTRDRRLRALTLSPAEIYGVADRLGSIEKGKIANLVVTRGEIFDDQHQGRNDLCRRQEVHARRREHRRARGRRPTNPGRRIDENSYSSQRSLSLAPLCAETIVIRNATIMTVDARHVQGLDRGEGRQDRRGRREGDGARRAPPSSTPAASM